MSGPYGSRNSVPCHANPLQKHTEYTVDIGMSTTTSPALDIYSCFVLGLVAGSDLHSDPNLRPLPAITCQLTADSPL